MLRRVAFPPADLVAVALGGFMTLSAITFIGRYGTGIGLGLTVGACLFVCVVAGFVLLPHVFVAGTIAYFALLPTLKVFVSDLLGGTKDVITFAALSAALILFVERRAARQSWPIDQAVLVLLAFVVGLYALNMGGNLSGESGYGARWFHGVRLFVEPLSMLLVGLSLREPRKTYRWATSALIWSALLSALYGIFQQTLGIDRLLSMGYDYGSYVRAISGHLRSFGTLEEPFSYAGFLLIGMAVLILRGRLRPVSLAILGLLSAGLLFSYVRTAIVITVALLALALARRGNVRLAITFALAAVIAGGTFFALAFDVRSERSIRVSPTQYLTLNGRTNIWSSALGHKRSSWLLGRGVGAVGTASQRAAESITGASTKPGASSKGGTVVDSGYLAAATDIGFVGLAILLALLLRLFVLGWRAASAGAASGWVALGVLTVILLDALTRESLTGFPTAYVGMLVVGLALSAAAAARLEAQASPPAT